MRTYFTQVFWGLLLVLLDFTINGFDLLIDGLGYLIIGIGCIGLSALSQKFAVAGLLCLVLANLWLISFAVAGELAVLIGLITTVANCLMIWQLLGGIIEFALQKQRADLAGRAEKRRILYVVIMLGSALLSFAMSGSRDATPLVILLVGAMLVLMVMILHLIHRVKIELAT